MSALPTVEDVRALLAYALANPYQFLTRGTVTTIVMLVAVVTVGTLSGRTAFLRRAAPSLAVILTYFGLGSLALAVQFFVRFHAVAPHETEVQLVSGVSHLAVALLGVALLSPQLRGRERADWLRAHTVALGYWTVELTAFTPEWFTFQGQTEVVRVGSLAVIAAAALVTAVLLVRAGIAARRSPLGALGRGPAVPTTPGPGTGENALT